MRLARREIRSWIRGTLTAVVALACTSSDVPDGKTAQEAQRTQGAKQAPAADSSERATGGRTLFEAYCAECHGMDARGNGSRTASLVRPPPDLGIIAQRNGQMFIDDAVASYIDGRRYVDAHGPTDMPTWGRTIDDRNSALREELKLTPELIAEIVAHLRTLQR